MSEFLEQSERPEDLASPEKQIEYELMEAIGRLIDGYLSEYKEDLLEIDDLDDLLGGVYGALLNEGYDPDDLLVEYGIIETGEGEI